MSPSLPGTGSARSTAARRLLAAAAALIVVPSVVVTTPSAAGAATTHNRSVAAAGWLGRQLGSEHLIVGDFGPDYGLTADVVLALDAAGVGRTPARKATKSLKRHVLDYTGGGDPSEFFAGSFAKLLNVAAAQGADPRAFGGSARTNLVRQLRNLETGNGRFSDVSSFGDFSNTFTQSLALVGLERTTKNGPSTKAVRYLRHQQCAHGGFPLELSTAGCKPSVDATAFAVQALLSTGGRKAHAAAMDGARWLARHQHANGSFTGNGTRNSNTTGLAAQALLAAGRENAADDAVSFLRSLQLGCGAKATDRGKVRYDKADSGDALRATAQAVPGLAGVPLTEISKAGARRGLPTLGCG